MTTNSMHVTTLCLLFRRPGIRSLIHDALQQGVPVAVCTNSHTRQVKDLLAVLLSPAILRQVPVYGGDLVDRARTKPHPDLFLLAASKMRGAGRSEGPLGLTKAELKRALVIEVPMHTHTHTDEFPRLGYRY